MLIKQENIKIIIPKTVYSQIELLNKETNTVEWSGIAFATIKGTISKPEKCVITLQSILPLDIGTASYTKVSLDDEKTAIRLIDYLSEDDNRLEMLQLQIHGHNNMGVFFSGTDLADLEAHTDTSNFIVSIVTNNRMQFLGKVAYKALTKSNEFSYYAKDENGKEYKVTTESSKLSMTVCHNCEFIIPAPQQVDEKLMKIITELKAEKAARTPVYNHNNFNKPISNFPAVGQQHFPQVQMQVNNTQMLEDTLDEDSLDSMESELYYLCIMDKIPTATSTLEQANMALLRDKRGIDIKVISFLNLLKKYSKDYASTPEETRHLLIDMEAFITDLILDNSQYQDFESKDLVAFLTELSAKLVIVKENYGKKF